MYAYIYISVLYMYVYIGIDIENTVKQFQKAFSVQSSWQNLSVLAREVLAKFEFAIIPETEKTHKCSSAQKSWGGGLICAGNFV